MSAPIVILGSINMDLVARTPRLPAAGETIIGSGFATIPGGKGANQAVAAARLARRDTRVHMIGRVGDDDFGRRLMRGLEDNGVETRRVITTKKTASGVAMIEVDGRGENSIVVVPGANAMVTPADVDHATDLIASAAAVVMQLEIPLATMRHAIRLCRRLGVFTILDPAPVPPDGLTGALMKVNLLSPNQHEAAALLGRQADAEALLAHGAESIALKLGGRGAMLVSKDQQFISKGFRVKVVDTTAAGDAFTAALAVARAEGMSSQEMMRFANAAGAVCCQTFGAQPSLPTRTAVEALMRRGTALQRPRRGPRTRA